MGLVETRSYTPPLPPEGFVLDCGRSLPELTLAYETYGQLNEARDNAILIVHALSGDAHVAGVNSLQDRKAGWWDIAVGPGKAYDTSQYYGDLLQYRRRVQGEHRPVQHQSDDGQALRPGLSHCDHR